MGLPLEEPPKDGVGQRISLYLVNYNVKLEIPTLLLDPKIDQKVDVKFKTLKRQKNGLSDEVRVQVWTIKDTIYRGYLKKFKQTNKTGHSRITGISKKVLEICQ